MGAGSGKPGIFEGQFSLKNGRDLGSGPAQKWGILGTFSRENTLTPVIFSDGVLLYII